MTDEAHDASGADSTGAETTAAEAGAAAEDSSTTGSVVRGERFRGGPARSFLSSLAADERIFAADLAVDRAHVVMLAEQGIVAEGVASEILTALAAVEAAGHDALPEGEDVHEAIESAVVDRVGPDGGRMHTARSRNDEVAACIRYRLREDLLAAAEASVGLRESLLSVAESHAETVMPGYTHLQPAQPTTVAHWALSYENAVARDTSRLLAAFARTNRSPLGAAAFAGTTFDVDRERTAALLGFDGVVRNAADAAAGRDFLVETVATLATQATTLSGLAADTLLFANRGLLTPADEYASTSSIMPQKVNPDTLELVRATAGDAVGGLTGLLTTLKGLPRAYNRDLQRATPHAWETVDAVTEATEVAAGAVATATWHEEALAAAAGEGFATATGVADLLAQAGVPFRHAHEAVAAAAADAEVALAEGDTDAAVAAVDAATESVVGEPATTRVDEATLRAALDPVESVASRDSAGGPAPSATAAEREAARAALVADRESIAACRQALAAAAETLDAEVSGYV
ncbi:argininosuccinate lyase [Halobaculum sp. MBLA0147]|uniref:argininosuccinate lyase n=1 Tax=Halobaculum sp. MBLA0147 TaxID=3079934 RepID=UPI003523F4B2